MILIVMGVVVAGYVWWAVDYHKRHLSEAEPPKYPPSVRVVPPVRRQDWKQR